MQCGMAVGVRRGAPGPSKDGASKVCSSEVLLFIFGCAALLSPSESQLSPSVAPPSRLEFSHFGYTSVNASWVGPSGPGAAASYDFRWRPVGEEEWIRGQEIPAPGSSFIVTGLLRSTQYEFVIQSRNNKGEYSSPLTAFGETISDYRATNVRAVIIKGNEVALAWEPARNGDLLSQQVFVSDDQGNSWKYNAVLQQGPMLAPISASLKVPFLMPMAKYLFRVMSFFLGYQGVSPSISSQIVTTLPARPQSVVGLRINNLQPTNATLSWEPLIGTGQMGALSVIYLIDVAEFEAPSLSRDSYVVRDGFSLEVSNLLRNVQYFFTVVARNDQGMLSSPSDRGLFTTLGALPVQMGPPTVIKTSRGLLLSWNPLVTNAATGGNPVSYFILYTKRQDEIEFDGGVNIGNILSFEVLALTLNYYYEFAIAAATSVGAGPRGKASVRQLPPLPPAMQAPIANVIDDGRTSVIEVSWIAPALAENVQNYRVFLRQVVPFTAMDNGTVVPASQRTYRFYNLPDGTRFEIKVAAETTSGLSNISSGVFAQTLSDTIPTSVKADMEVTGVTKCSINVTWTKPRLSIKEFRVFSTIVSITGAVVYLTGSTQPFYAGSECSRGAAYVFYVQAVFADNSGGIISLDSPVIDVPVSPPNPMSGPTVIWDPRTPSTAVIVSWVPPVIINPVPKSIVTHYILTVGWSLAINPADATREITIKAPATSYSLTGLAKKTYYTFRIQAVNSLGRSVESPVSSTTTDITPPAPATNLSVVPGSESPNGDALTLQWDVTDWGESDRETVGSPAPPYPYCAATWPKQTKCVGYRYFLVTPFRVGDDYRDPIYVYGNSFKYEFTGLSGGVDYTFVVVAINTGGLESAKSMVLKYRTVSVAPRAIKSLNVKTPPNPDVGANYLILLEWKIPIDAETTGGMALSGFVIQHAELTACSGGCADLSQSCILQRSNILWGDTATVGAVDQFIWTGGLKGSTYVFRFAAFNGKGLGAFWPSCLHSDVNCAGVSNGQLPYTCFSAVYTLPAPPKKFGDWAEDSPGAQPSSLTTFTIRWGKGSGNQAGEYFNYLNRATNGGRNIEQIEIQRAKLPTPTWPIDFYCPTLPAVDGSEEPVCLYRTGCIPEPCKAACPICITSTLTQNPFDVKKIDDYIKGEPPDPTATYVYRIRVSNVGINDCALRGLSSGSSPNCDWSEWSDLAEVQLWKPTRFNNLFAKVNSPSEIEVLWFPPREASAGIGGVSTWGDQINVYFGPTVASVSVAPYAGSNVTKTGLFSQAASFQKFAIPRLVPSTVYYFSVVAYYVAENKVMETTRSDVFGPVKTVTGKPARVKNVTCAVPSNQADVQSGAIIVTWVQLRAICAEGSGVYLSDGSLDNCERGELAALSSYKIYYKTAIGGSWQQIVVSSALEKFIVRGLEKETTYLFKVAAVNSVSEGEASIEVQGTPIATIPGSPPPPLSTGASTSSVRVAWKEPADLGTKQIQTTKFRLTIDPRRDGRPGNETVTFTWERDYVVAGLKPNSLYLFSVAYQASPMLGFGFSSRTAYVFTTPLPPVNLRQLDGTNTTDSTTVRIKWTWPESGNGNVTITGYRLTFESSDGVSKGQTYCSGGSSPVGGIGNALSECVLAGLVNGKLYSITIAASNDPRLQTNFGPDSSPMILQTKPSTPTVVNIEFTNTSANSTKIWWTTYDGGLKIIGHSYQIGRENEEYDNSHAMTGVLSAPVDGGIRSSYVVTGLGANLFYTFIIVARNELGFRPSEPSPTIKTKPPAPSIPTVKTVSSYSTKVSWAVWYGKNDLTEYSIQSRLNMDAGNIGDWFVSGTVQGQEYEVTSLNANSGYDVRVAAMNSAGTSEYGESVHVTTLASPPDFIYVSRIGAGDCELRWQPTPGATPEYTVFPSRWMSASSSWVEEQSRKKFEGEIDSFYVTGLTKGARYKFQVATSSASGVGFRSAMSHEVRLSSSLPAPGPKPMLSNPSVAGLLVSWPAVDDGDSAGGTPVTGYVLYSFAHMYEGGGWKKTATLLPASDTKVIPTTYVAAGLRPDVNYQFRLAVVNANGEGPPGVESEKMPTVPGTLQAPFQQSFLKTILLTWTPPENNSFTAYRVGISEYALNPTGSNPEDLWKPWVFQIFPVSTTIMKYDSLNPDYPYRFKVAARNPSGWGADSPVVQARTTIVADAWAMTDSGLIALQISSPITTTSVKVVWVGPASTDSTRRGSSVGFRITACQVENGICDNEYNLKYCELTPPNEYTKSHVCDRSINYYQRDGLLKNTLYNFQLSVVNSGGEGPRSKASPPVRTQASYPVQMAQPTATSLSLDSMSVTWDRMIDWNQRGGLDITSYVLFKQAEGFSYDAGEVVYEGTSYTYTNLPSNTKFYFAVIAENTWCTLCRTDIIVPEGSCFFELCCGTHTCSPKSPNSIAVSTLPGQMTFPRLQFATIYDIQLTWDVVPGTPNNIFEYKIRFRDIDRADKDDSGGWVERIFAGTLMGQQVKDYNLVNLDPNNRYEVILNANNRFGYGQPSDSAILVTKANRIQSVEVFAVRATEVTLTWNAPPGRRNNVLGYNVSYRFATHTEILMGQQLEILPLSYVTSPGVATSFNVVNLRPNSTYIFSVAAINGGGNGEFSIFTRPINTMILDMLGSCYFYPASNEGNGVVGSFILQQKASGTATLQGSVQGITAFASYSLGLLQYGKSTTRNYGVIQSISNFTATLDGEFSFHALETSLMLQGKESAISSSLVLHRSSDGLKLSQCEMGMSKPRSGARENGALPPVHSRAFCNLVPLSGVRLSGGFITSPTDFGIRVRGRVCGISRISSKFSVRLHEFGDIHTGNYDVIGDSVNDMGSMYIDNLDSANFDLIDATAIGFRTGPNLINVMGRSVVLYNQSYPFGAKPNVGAVALAACVWGAHEPSLDTTVFQVEALPPVCTECTWLMGLQESMYTVAELFQTDWLSVWSLNKANNPDKDKAGTSVYYAHPYVMQEGENMASVQHRFGITKEHIALLNYKKTEFLPGQIVCIVPMWTKAINRNGAYVCSEERTNVSVIPST